MKRSVIYFLILIPFLCILLFSEFSVYAAVITLFYFLIVAWVSTYFFGWKYVPGGTTLLGGTPLDCWVLRGKGKVWRTYSTHLEFEAYWDKSRKSKRCATLKEGMRIVEENS